MSPPGSVYLAALRTRFPTTCSRRVVSAWSGSGSPVRWACRVWFFASSSGRVVSRAWRTASPRSTGSQRSSTLPRVMRDTSSRSSTRRTRCWICRWMTATARPVAGVPRSAWARM